MSHSPGHIFNRYGVPLRNEFGDFNIHQETGQILSEIVNINPQPKAHENHENRDLKLYGENIFETKVTHGFCENVNSFLFSDIPSSEIKFLTDSKVEMIEVKSVIVKLRFDLFLRLV